MSRKFVVFAAAAIALGSVAVASGMARSSIVQPYKTKADFDRAFGMAAASPGVMSAKAAIEAEKLRQAGLKRVNLAQAAR
jgi:hypothetical protein